MPCVLARIAEHALNIWKGAKKTLRRFVEPKRGTMGEEIAKLLAASFIHEVSHPDWLAKPVMVPKKNKT